MADPANTSLIPCRAMRLWSVLIVLGAALLGSCAPIEFLGSCVQRSAGCS